MMKKQNKQHKKAPPLLPYKGAREQPLFFVVTTLSFLICLCALVVQTTWRTAEGWTEDLNSEMTVQIKPPKGQKGEILAQKGVKVLSSLSGVAKAEALPREQAEALLEPWLGQDNLPDDLPLPYLITIKLEPGALNMKTVMAQSLEKSGIPASIDDHGRWSGDILRTAQGLQTLALLILALLGGAAVAAIGFAARAVLASQHETVDALHLCGARDGFIIKIFVNRFSMLGFKAGCVGSVLASLSALGLWVITGRDAGFLPIAGLSVFDALLLIFMPFALAVIAAFASWRTVSHVLRQMT